MIFNKRYDKQRLMNDLYDCMVKVHWRRNKSKE